MTALAQAQSVPAYPATEARSVVERGLGLSWQVDADPYALGLDALLGLALRDNPKRAQLVVSRVLGKHLPVAPHRARAAGLLLAGLVAQSLSDSSPPQGRDLPPGRGPGAPAGALDDRAWVDRNAVASLPAGPVVLGFCETATALGHVVAEAFAGACYVHTTRRPDPAVPPTAGFDEEHSHAVSHVLQLRDPTVLDDPCRPLVLVDDELSTGTTALNTIAALHRLRPRDRYLVATLLDLRPPGVRQAFADRAERLGVRVDVVALLAGSLDLPPDVLDRAVGLRAELARVPVAPPPSGHGRVRALRAPWPAGLPLGGRTGLTTSGRPGQMVESALTATGDLLTARLSGGRVLVLGTEELMWAPLRLAALLPGDVRYQSTTRSPVLPADVAGYAVRRAVHFPAPDEPGRTSRLHGLGDDTYDDIVVVTDRTCDAALPLAEALRPWAHDGVHVLSLGTG